MAKSNLKNKIQQRWRHWRESRNLDPNQVTPDPFKTWRILAFSWFILLLLILAGITYLSWQLDKPITPGQVDLVTLPRLDQGLLKEVEKFVADRAAQFAAASDNPPVAIDPAR